MWTVMKNSDYSKQRLKILKNMYVLIHCFPFIFINTLPDEPITAPLPASTHPLCHLCRWVLHTCPWPMETPEDV